LGETLAAQSMADLGQRGSLGIREFQPPFQLRPEHPIFGSQIFDLRQQLLVHRPRDVSQDARPIHPSSASADSQLIAPKIVASATRRGYAGHPQLTVFITVSIFWPYGIGFVFWPPTSGTRETFTLAACTHPYLKGIKSVFCDLPPLVFATSERDHII